MTYINTTEACKRLGNVSPNAVRQRMHRGTAPLVAYAVVINDDKAEIVPHDQAGQLAHGPLLYLAADIEREAASIGTVDARRGK